MRCFSKRAAQQQHLQEEVKWLQQMLAKEQQSKQAVLGQLQDERAKSALLELEILHAAQAAQEMGESLCMFFNPCFSNQQSEHLLLQQAQGQASSEQHTPSAEQQLAEEPPLLSAGLFAVHGCAEQQQEPAVLLTAAELGKGATAQPPALTAEASHQDTVSAGSDADTAAHDQQMPLRLRESAALLASTEQWLSEARLHSPRRSRKALGSPGRKSSPRRLARSSPCRSLRLSNSSSPLKPPAVSAATASAACERSSGTDQQQQVQSDGPYRAPLCHPPAGVKAAPGSAATAAASSTCNVDAPQQMGAQPLSAQQQQAAVDAPADAASADVPGSIVPANSKPTLRAAAAAAAAVQQSLSAARAAIAAAEAVRGQSRVNIARSHHRGGSPGSNTQTAPAVGASAFLGDAEKSASHIAAGATEAPVISSLRVDTATADLGKEGSGLECKSSSSDGSTWGGPSHKLPASIVSEAQEPAGAPTAAATEAAAGNQSGPFPDSSTLQQGQQSGSSAAAPASICPLWQPAQLSSQPVSQLVSNLSRKSQTTSSGADQGSPAAATLEPGAEQQPTDGTSSSNSARSFAVTQHSEPEQQVQQAAVAAESDAAALPAKPAGSEVDTADPTDTLDASASTAADVQGTATDAAGSAGSAVAESAAAPAVPAAQPASCSLAPGVVPAPAAAGSGCRLPLAGAATVRRSSAARPPLPPVQAASAAQHAALKLAYGPSHRQACSSRGNSAAGTPRAAEDHSALPRLPHPRLQEQQKQQQQQQGPPPKAAAAAVGTVGPMHAAAFGPQQHSGTQFSTSGTLQSVASSSHGRDGSMPEYKASVYQTGRQAAAAAAAEDIYANLPPVPEVYKPSTLCSRQQQSMGQRQLMPRRLYSDDTGSDTNPDRQHLLMPQDSSSAYGPPAWSTAAAAAAARAGAAGPAYAAGKELEMCHAAVRAPVKEATAASCLSPLHWHQSNLGSSRAGFYQAMMLAACSSPTRVMQQQRAFDQQDTQAAARAVCRQLAGRGAGGSGSKGLMSGKRHRAAAAAAARKPRRGWMALF